MLTRLGPVKQLLYSTWPGSERRTCDHMCIARLVVQIAYSMHIYIYIIYIYIIYLDHTCLRAHAPAVVPRHIGQRTYSIGRF